MSTFNKPVIAMRKDDETAFVNARTYWSLSVHDNGTMYELRVRHQAPEDSLSFYWLDAAERGELELVTEAEYRDRRDAIVWHEGGGYCTHSEHSGVPATTWLLIPSSGQYVRVCDGCAESLPQYRVRELDETDMRNRADFVLSDTVTVATVHQSKIMAHLRATWEAFALLFEPAGNL